jgi:hypothetical protein
MLGMEPPRASGAYCQNSDLYVEELLCKEFPGEPWMLDADARDRRSKRQEKFWDQLRMLEVAPWSAASFPHFAAWVEKNRKPLDLIVAASKCPRFFSPLIGRGERPVLTAGDHYDSTFGRATRGLIVRAMLELNDGKAVDAQNDLLACCRLSSLMAQHPLVSYRLEANLM